MIQCKGRGEKLSVNKNVRCMRIPDFLNRTVLGCSLCCSFRLIYVLILVISSNTLLIRINPNGTPSMIETGKDISLLMNLFNNLNIK
jgi:hypothetical protein